MDIRSFVRNGRLPVLVVLVAALAACGDTRSVTPLSPDVPSAFRADDCGYIGSGGCALGGPSTDPEIEDCGYIGSGGCRVVPLGATTAAENGKGKGPK